jgi:hypothetical protein
MFLGAAKAPLADDAHPIRENRWRPRKQKSPNRLNNRFGLYCPTPDWQHWQPVSNDW